MGWVGLAGLAFVSAEELEEHGCAVYPPDRIRVDALAAAPQGVVAASVVPREGVGGELQAALGGPVGHPEQGDLGQ